MIPAHYLHKALVSLRDAVENGARPDYGICSASAYHLTAIMSAEHASEAVIRKVRNDASIILDTVMVTWPEFSGRPAYPVKGPYILGDGERMWERGDYAAARRRLLDYCINVTERML